MRSLSNRIFLKISGKWFRAYSIVKHTGRRSGREYRNPVSAYPLEDGFVIAVLYGAQSQWVRNVMATGRLTLLTDTIVESLEYDAPKRRATALRLIKATTGERSTARAPLVFLCTGSINSLSLLLRSASADAPRGLGNSSDLLGRYVMDHVKGDWVLSTVPGIDDQMYLGRRPNGITMPRFVNVAGQDADFLRGYSYQGGSGRATWKRGGEEAGIGAEFKQKLRQPGGWQIALEPNVECLPSKDNRVTINFDRKDKYGLPLTRIDVRWGENERKAAAHARKQAAAMLSLLGGEVITFGSETRPPGTAIHEMGGASMGEDPRNSVTNPYNQLHDAPNVFVTDGAFMNSSGDRNPSLTYMAFTVRAAVHAADLLKNGAL